MAYFQTENPNLGKFWKVLQWKLCIGIFIAILSMYVFIDILLSFGIFFPILVCCNEKNLATLVFPTILEQADQSMD
jgi:hypothetical protein